MGLRPVLDWEVPLGFVGSARTNRRERILSMNRMNLNGESGLADTEDVTTSVSDNYRYVIEDLVAKPYENAPHAPENSTPAQSGQRARSVGNSGLRQQNITERRRMVISDISHISSNEDQQLRFQLDTEAAEIEVREERLAILRLELETERAELDARKDDHSTFTPTASRHATPVSGSTRYAS